MALRVATYNIQVGVGEDGVFDPDRQAEAMRALRADVIGVQEVDVHWEARSQWRDLATELAAALDMRLFFARIHNLDPPGEAAPRRRYGLAILSRYPIVHAANHPITRINSLDPGQPPAPAPGFPEAIVDVRGALVQVYATHLDYRPDPAVRQAQVAEMRRIMADSDHTQRVLLGDFNAVPDAPVLAPLWQHLTDAWYAVNGAAGGETFPADVPVKRIDYVAVSSGIAVTGCEVPVTVASDHRPVVADLVVAKGA